MGPYPREESLHRTTTPDRRLGLDDTNVAQGPQRPRDEKLRLRGVGCGPPAPGAGAECALLSGFATGSWGGGGLREGQHLALSLGTHLEMAPPDFTKQLGASSLRGQRTRLSKRGPPRGGHEVCRNVHGARGEGSGLGGESDAAPAHSTPASGVLRHPPRTNRNRAEVPPAVGINKLVWFPTLVSYLS